MAEPSGDRPISRFLLLGLALLGLAACASERPGLTRAADGDGSTATFGPKAAVVLESRKVEVEDPHANRNHTGAAYTGAVMSTIVADVMSNDGAVVAAAMLAGLGAGWMIGELSEESLPGHAYVVKDTKSGEVYTVVQPTRGNDWLLPPGTEVFVIGERRTARVVPETDESWFWERPEPEPAAPAVVWREPQSRLGESGPRPE